MEFVQFIEAGCDREDLNWALFNVPFNFQKKVELPKKIKRFFHAVDAILPHIEELRKELDVLIELPAENGTALATFVTAWGQILPSLNIPQELKRIRHTSKSLSALYVWLDAIRAIRIDNPMSSALATSAYEILLVEYITRATTKTISREQISSQMEVACEAYGIKGRSYSEVAVTRRYGRFKRDFPKEFTEIGRIVKEFLVRKSRGETVSLIPFFHDSYLSWIRLNISERHLSDRDSVVGSTARTGYCAAAAS